MSKTIQLKNPILWHDKQLSEVTLREPTAADYFAIGELANPMRRKDGSTIMVEDVGAISAYVERCLITEGGAHLLPIMSLADGMEVRAAIVDFFSIARQGASKN